MEVKISTSASSLPLHQFLTRLLEDGRMLTAVGEHQRPPEPDDAEASVRFLQSQHEKITADAPSEYPGFNPAIALAAAESLAWFGSVLLDRSATDQTLPDWLANQSRILGKVSDNISDHASVDIVFRFVPDWVTRAEKNAADNELIELWTPLLSPWPLACVGTKIENPEAAKRVICGCPALATMIADRILTRHDVTRRDDPAYDPWIRRAVGDHNSLDIPHSSRPKS